MKKIQIMLAFAAIMPLGITSMERAIQRSRSMENIHSIEDNRSAAQKARAEQLRSTLQTNPAVPAAPVFKPAAKQPTPPAPQQPQSFYRKHKKEILVASAGIGAGILLTGGFLAYCSNRVHQSDLLFNEIEDA